MRNIEPRNMYGYEKVFAVFVSASSCASSIAFTDQPIRREFSDVDTRVLNAQSLDGWVSVNALPPLAVRLRQNNHTLELSWPAWPGKLTLQEATTLSPPDWRNSMLTPKVTADRWTAETAVEGTAKFYRLAQ